MKNIKDKAILNFSGDVTTQSIYGLVTNLDTKVNYYKFDHVKIEIDSPGGEVSALKLFINRLRQFRRKGVVIETHAISSVSSAAAVMLTLGDVGYRSAEKDARILFHNARIDGNLRLTSTQAKQLTENLKEVDDHIFEQVITHNLPAIEKRFQSETPLPEKNIKSGALQLRPSQQFEDLDKFTKNIVKKYQKLFEADEPLSAEQITDLGLIDQVITY